MSSKPETLNVWICTAQVCVPKSFTDAEAEDFINLDSPTGISSSWRMCKNGEELLAGDSERVQCLEREDCVHIKMVC